MNRHKKSRSKTTKRDDLFIKFGVFAAFIILAIIIVLIVTTLTNNTKVAKAAPTSNTVTTYHSVTVAEGDTLWTIAGKYCPEYSNDKSDTVRMLINLNNLSSDQIHIGGHILVPVEIEV